MENRMSDDKIGSREVKTIEEAKERIKDRDRNATKENNNKLKRWAQLKDRQS